MSLTEHRTTSAVSAALAKDRLGVPSVVFFVMSAAAPLLVTAGVVTTAYAVTGVTGVPLAYILLGAILGLFAVGFVTMSRYVVNAGAFYAYTAKGLGRPVGVATAWVALLAYNALVLGLYGIIGSAVEPLLGDWFGISPPWWLIALVFWALTGVLGLMRVDVNGKILAVLLLSEIAFVIVFDIAGFFHPAAATGFSPEVFNPGNFFAPGFGALLAICVASFSGFESSVVFAEETKNPKRTVPLATYLALAVITVLYTISSWAMIVPVGTDEIAEAAGEQGPGLLFGLAEQHLGSTISTIGSVLFATSIVAAMIAFHNTTSRYIFALGRENVLPAAFGRTHPRTGAPLLGSLSQSVLGLVAIVIYAIFSSDPLVEMFFTLGSFGGFGLLVLLTTTSVAVFAFFAKNPGLKNAWRTQIAPGIASVLLFCVLGLALINFDKILGVEPDSLLRWLLPALYLLGIGLGIAWAMFLRAKRSEIYANIGLGAQAAVRRSS
ncbi:APC family permease [Sphaerimonospora thailandensis]|uniref:Amino acid permease n=1 Tax=Sphaerimonospora thailandensis TaxID=795644 RepID=A0A8J3RID4_9ACTN|nr:APC family permease [Sphaerimonospora thailandensis]GIH72913.1 amino acid permease [Sphaerimonospora thailandensis]